MGQGAGRTTGRAAMAAVLGRSTSDVRALAGGLTFAAVIATVWLPQPVSFTVWPVLAVTAVAVAILPLLRGAIDDRWQSIGPLVALAYVLGVVLLTGAGDSIYHDLMVVAVAMAALTRGRASTIVTTVLGIAVVTVPGVLSGAAPAFYTDALFDAVVVATIALVVFQQSSALRQQAERLQRRADETQELLDREHAVVQKLEELEVTRRTFARNIAHEVRTPLTVLGGTVGVLRHALPPDHQGRDLADAMDRQCARLLEMVETMDVVFDHGPMLRQRPAIRLDHVVALAVARAPVTSDAVQVNRGDGLEDGARVFVDDQLLVDALVHLLRNSHVHAGPDADVAVDLEAHGDALHVVVRDAGPGWGHDDPEGYLEPFVQGDQAATAPSPGIGLGLSLVAAAAGSHGGHVELGRCPELGGALVRVVLPDAVTPPSLRLLDEHGRTVATA